MNLDVPSGAIAEVKEGLIYGTPTLMTFLKKLVDCCLNPRVQRLATVDRPTRYIEPGYMIYDTTINKLIILQTVTPIQWRDAMGNIV